MMKRLLKAAALRAGYDLRNVSTDWWLKRDSYSHYGEDEIIARLIERAGVTSRFAVDIAAGAGVELSNTLALWKQGWNGLCVEGEPCQFALLAERYARFERVQLARAWVSPPTVSALLDGHGVPREFGFLSFDIDSYDYFVLEALLSTHRPALFCAEVNQAIPPPIRFAVRYDPDFRYRSDGFFGMSLSALHDLTTRHDYALVAPLEYNNAFYLDCELARRAGLESLTPKQAYAHAPRHFSGAYGAREFPTAPDYPLAVLQDMALEQGVQWLQKRFAGRGPFLCEV